MDTKILSENNFKFNKQFGQNFIFDKNLLTAIVKDSNITKQDDKYFLRNVKIPFRTKYNYHFFSIEKDYERFT